MRDISSSTASAVVGTRLGLFRQETLDTGPANTLMNLFADLRRVNRGEIIGEDTQRHLQGTRLLIDCTQGHGSWELYRLDQDLYMVAADGLYDEARIEMVPGEGLVEFHLALTGVLEMTMPGCARSVMVTGPRLLMMYQPPGVNISERVMPKVRHTCVSLYCRLPFLAEFAHRSGVARWSLLEEIEKHNPSAVWHQQAALSPTLQYIGKSLLENPYQRGVRLLHAEAKALELLCEMLATAQEQSSLLSSVISEGESRQLDAARLMLATQLGAPVRIRAIARAVGMSESKLKRAFKARFGVTIFDYGLGCRMRHALELLRCKRMSAGEVADAVGYQHQSSFSSAFYRFFGFLPSKARTRMH